MASETQSDVCTKYVGRIEGGEGGGRGGGGGRGKVSMLPVKWQLWSTEVTSNVSNTSIVT